MSTSCPVLTPTEKQVIDIIKRADDTLAAAVSAALEEAVKQAGKDMQALSREDATPVIQYFASVVHQRMYGLICGADPDTLEGGDPEIAHRVIRNSQNIAKHYWSADIEPYPSGGN